MTVNKTQQLFESDCSTRELVLEWIGSQLNSVVWDNIVKTFVSNGIPWDFATVHFSWFSCVNCSLATFWQTSDHRWFSNSKIIFFWELKSCTLQKDQIDSMRNCLTQNHLLRNHLTYYITYIHNCLPYQIT